MRINQKGFTILEMVIVIAITMLLMSSVGVLMYNNERMVKRTTQTIDAKSIALIAQEYIEDELRYAYIAEITTDTISELEAEDAQYLRVKENHTLEHHDSNGVDKLIVAVDAMKGTTLNVEFNKVSGKKNVLKVDVTVSGKDISEYALSNTIVLNNMGIISPKTTEIEGISGNTIIYLKP
ncbi:MAG: type II secretion system GspH family protein [Candidatus Niameybacter stercoravium]|nr:type II secretion system GspH family protein [Candidatus Niameybacter stercoravium]